jgi:vacuolar-type H+-ATPase subunit E/Vma4
MGYKELIDSLRKEGEEKLRSLRGQCEAAAEKMRAEKEEKIQLLREEFRKKEALEIRNLQADLFSGAEKTARSLRLSAEKALSERLYVCARSLLHELRGRNYHDVFMSLARELPAADWADINVNPDDGDRARTVFPGARILCDPSITGGMEAVSAEGTQRIINTFEKRLERAWEELLPLLVSAAYREGAPHGVSSGDRG